jgi:hypothetical protein
MVIIVLFNLINLFLFLFQANWPNVIDNIGFFLPLPLKVPQLFSNYL